MYALTMGSGKTILMATMMLYDFVLSYYHPKDARFAKNALVFAPDTTIIESLEELTNEVFAKEVGFHAFQETNKNFEYRISFNALLQQEQVKFFEEIADL